MGSPWRLPVYYRLIRISPCCSSRAFATTRRDYYEVLGVKKTASEKEIKDAYFSLSKQLHPDSNPLDKNLHDRMVEINEAYSVLGRAEKRKQYDQQRGFGGGTPFDSGRSPFEGGRPDRPPGDHGFRTDQSWRMYEDMEDRSAPQWAEMRRAERRRYEQFQRKMKPLTVLNSYILLFTLTLMTLVWAIVLSSRRERGKAPQWAEMRKAERHEYDHFRRNVKLWGITYTFLLFFCWFNILVILIITSRQHRRIRSQGSTQKLRRRLQLFTAAFMIVYLTVGLLVSIGIIRRQGLPFDPLRWLFIDSQTAEERKDAYVKFAVEQYRRDLERAEKKRKAREAKEIAANKSGDNSETSHSGPMVDSSQQPDG